MLYCIKPPLSLCSSPTPSSFYFPLLLSVTVCSPPTFLSPSAPACRIRLQPMSAATGFECSGLTAERLGS